ncbi:zonula occludens-like protein polychaetoid isoform X19 [Oratosquilla oratoria]|uniref:zonula occludens-like protein polychaetoid isoform X19 n=1 Tax=Oratosquilla oratoria TaxID=337810 RepID=UPI003F76352A
MDPSLAHKYCDCCVDGEGGTPLLVRHPPPFLPPPPVPTATSTAGTSTTPRVSPYASYSSCLLKEGRLSFNGHTQSSSTSVGARTSEGDRGGEDSKKNSMRRRSLQLPLMKDQTSSLAVVEHPQGIPSSNNGNSSVVGRYSPYNRIPSRVPSYSPQTAFPLLRPSPCACDTCTSPVVDEDEEGDSLYEELSLEYHSFHGSEHLSEGKTLPSWKEEPPPPPEYAGERVIPHGESLSSDSTTTVPPHTPLCSPWTTFTSAAQQPEGRMCLPGGGKCFPDGGDSLPDGSVIGGVGAGMVGTGAVVFPSAVFPLAGSPRGGNGGNGGGGGGGGSGGGGGGLGVGVAGVRAVEGVLRSLGGVCGRPSSRATEVESLSTLYEDLPSRRPSHGRRKLKGGERVVWEFHNVTLTRVPGYGFGIAVSGGRDNPHFTNGDPSIAISDVLKAGPAEGKLQINDRLISANGVSLENVDYSTAVQVLRDSGAAVHLVVKRRIVLPASPEPQTLKVTLTKNKKKDDFGIVLGCRIYVKEILNKTLAEKDGGLREGDILLRINSSSTENLTLKEAKKLVDGTKEKLQLMVKRDPPPLSASRAPSHDRTEPTTKDPRNTDYSDTRPNYSTQNLYVQPPTRGGSQDGHRNFYPGDPLDSKNNLMRWEVLRCNPPGQGFPSLESPYGLDEPGSPPSDDAPPPRPPLPRPEDYYTRQGHGDPNSPSKAKIPVPDPRFVSFKKEGSVGIRLTGGNEVGIYVTAVQPGSQAQLQGLIPGDKILKVNDMDMAGVTREEAVLYLMSLQDQIDLIVQTRIQDYENIISNQKGDLFYIKTHFHYEPSGKGELSFRSGDIFRVVNTLHGGVVGHWQVHRIGRNNQETQKGVIPNKARAEELATAQFNAAKKEQTQSESRGGFFKRRRNSRRSKSLGKDHWEDVVFADCVSKFPAYERVNLRHPGFVRPIVLFGPLADIARDNLLSENPDKFASPRIYMRLTMPIPYYGYPYPHLRELDSSGEKPSGIIRLSAIREIMERGKHALLDITPNAVDRLNYAQFYPIVIFLRAESKHIVKELRTGLPKYEKGRMSSKKLFDQCVKLEKLWSHVFTATISLTQPDTWYRKVREIVDKQQSGPIWMSETKPFLALSDDFLFPMTSRLSYASSPESDMETGPESRTPSKSPFRNVQSSSSSSSQAPHYSAFDSRDPRGRLVKSSSDPSIAAPDESTPGYMGSGLPKGHIAPPPYSASPHKLNSYDMTSPVLGPNAHDDLKSVLHPRSPHEQHRYNRSSSQPPAYRDEQYRYSDYKPLPPPKSSANYKPVPPPKPKNYKPQAPPSSSSSAGHDSGLGGYGICSDVRKTYDRGPYHASSNGGLSDDYSGLDSGQGSSLDRKYDTFGRSSYSKVVTSTGRTGYYLNVPPPRDGNQGGGGGGGGGGGPGGRDLPNHDYRGSAFELYKKPPDPRAGPPGPPVPHGMQYTDYSSRRWATDEGKHKVIATARGVFDHRGGTLTSEETGVSIVIPSGALPKGNKQEIYFKVCQDSSLVPPLDRNKGETLLSPLVMCGPHGLQFCKPVELRLPHAASVSPNTWSFALKSSDTPSGQPTQWTNMALADAPHSSHIGANCVSVLVDHF